MRDNELVEVHMQQITLAVLVRALLRLILSPFKWLFDWLYDDTPHAWLVPGGFAASDPDLMDQWDKIYELQAAFTNKTDATQVVDTFISRGISPLSALAFYVGCLLKRENTAKEGRILENLPEGERLFESDTDAADDAETALHVLGWRKRDAIKAIGAAVIKLGSDASTEDLIKEALKKE